MTWQKPLKKELILSQSSLYGNQSNRNFQVPFQKQLVTLYPVTEKKKGTMMNAYDQLTYRGQDFSLGNDATHGKQMFPSLLNQ